MTFFECVQSAVTRRGAAVMGICNVTPDSFSDGGHFASHDRARARVDEMLLEGADIIDIGGESTRPGAPAVSPAEQLERVLSVVEWAAARACVSIDTTSATVAAACLDVGAHAVNDVSLLSEPALAQVTAGSGAALILSHARGAGAGKRWSFSDVYDDVVQDVVADWERAAEGLPREMLVMDPGLGFSKPPPKSLELLRRAGELVAAVDVPVLLGASRKSFLGLVGNAPPDQRIGASVVAALHAVRAGVRIVRVHDVRATRQALDLAVVLSVPSGHAGGL